MRVTPPGEITACHTQPGQPEGALVRASLDGLEVGRIIRARSYEPGGLVFDGGAFFPAGGGELVEDALAAGLAWNAGMSGVAASGRPLTEQANDTSVSQA